MSDQTGNNNLMKLIIILSFQLLSTSNAKHVNGDVFSGFSSRTSLEDLVASGAEPRPVVVEQPEVLPLIADENAFSDSALSEASEKVEKVLKKPLAFSYDKSDQSPEASEDEEKEAEVVEVDQTPSAIDYYKHVSSLESEENDDGAGSEHEKVESSEKEDQIKAELEDQSKVELEDQSKAELENQSNAEIENESKAELENQSNAEIENESKAELENQSNAEIENQSKAELENQSNAEIENESKAELENQSNAEIENQSKAELDGQTKSELEEHEVAKIVEDSELQHSHHHRSDHKKAGGDEGGSHGDNHDYKKGGAEKHHSNNKGEEGEKGNKAYKGDHYHEKGEKGHHTKEDHEKEYEENGGQKKNHHHDDGYAANLHKGEKGHKNSKFHEKGHHSKGHSTKGEHSIHKKDEYEKKQEFFDESNEEDGFEKEGDYFHESDYKKGGHEKGGSHNGGEEEAHFGKKDHHEKGGYFKDGKGHKESHGHGTHYEHEHKKGEKENNSGGKKWSYGKGTGGGGGGGGEKHGGKYQQADSSNVPIHVVDPNKEYKDVVTPRPVPELILEENVKYFKKPNILYPPLPPKLVINSKQEYPYIEQNKKFQLFDQPKLLKQKIYDTDDISEVKPIRKINKPIRRDKVIEERLVIQRRSDELEEESKESSETVNQDHPEFTSKITNQDNFISDGLKVREKDFNTEKKIYKENIKPSRFDRNHEDSSEYDFFIDNTKNNNVGPYSVFTLGDYNESKVNTPLVQTDKNEEIHTLESVINNKKSDILSDSSEVIVNTTTSQSVNDSTPQFIKTLTEINKNNYNPPQEITTLSISVPKGFQKKDIPSKTDHYGINSSPVTHEGYEKPKYITISSSNEHYKDDDNTTIHIDDSVTNEAITIPTKSNNTNEINILKEQVIDDINKVKIGENRNSVISTMKPIVVEDVISEELDN